jgi:hypothetical protein
LDLNIYKLTTLRGAVRRMMPVHSFLRSTFFPDGETFPTEEVLLDFKKGKRKMAPFVAPRVGGVTMDRQGYRTDKYSPPKIAPQRPITVDDLMIRGMGESLISEKTPASRQAALLGQDLNELDEMISRREEWMVRELLFGGKITMKGFIDLNNQNMVVSELDYGFTNKEVLTTGKWGTAEATIYADIKGWRLEVIKKSGRAPTILVLGQTASDAFLNDEDIQKKMDIKNMLLAQVNPVIKSDALTFLGRLMELGLDIYTYNDWFLDDNGVEQPMVPDDHILLARPNLGKFHYGAVTQMEKGVFVTVDGNRVPKSWADEENERRMLRLTSKPVPVPEDVDDWFVADVL